MNPFKSLILAASLVLSTTASAAYPSTLILEKERTVELVGEVMGAEALSITNSIMSKVDGSGKPIYMFINSPGGSMLIGQFILNAMDVAKQRGHRIVCGVGSLAASMAFSIFANCDARYALSGAQLLFHPPRVSVMMATITPERAQELADGLTQADKEVKQLLISKFPASLNREWFERNYRQETMFSAKRLQAELGGEFLSIVDDIQGTNNLFNFLQGQPSSQLVKDIIQRVSRGE